MKQAFLLILTIGFLECDGQSTQSVNLFVEDLVLSEDTILFSLGITNNAMEALAFLKPELVMVDESIMAIMLRDFATNETYDYFYTAKYDIDNILLSCKNSIVLNSGESFETKFRLSVSDFITKVKQGRYIFSVFLNYSSVPFNHQDKSCSVKIFTGQLRSNTIDITIQ